MSEIDDTIAEMEREGFTVHVVTYESGGKNIQQAHLPELADECVICLRAEIERLTAERDALLMAWGKTRRLLPGPRGMEVSWTAEESLQMEIIRALDSDHG